MNPQRNSSDALNAITRSENTARHATPRALEANQIELSEAYLTTLIRSSNEMCAPLAPRPQVYSSTKLVWFDIYEFVGIHNSVGIQHPLQLHQDCRVFAECQLLSLCCGWSKPMDANFTACFRYSINQICFYAI